MASNKNREYVIKHAESARRMREVGLSLEVSVARLGGYLDALNVAESTKLSLHNLFFSIVDGKEGAQ